MASKIERAIAKRVGAPLGEPLTGLAKLGVHSELLIMGPQAWEWGHIPDLEEELGIVVVGRTGNGFFGPVRAELGRSASNARWIYADRQGLPPERVGRLAEFLSVWCFVPDFFELHDSKARDLSALHSELFASAELESEVRVVRKLRGVRTLKTGSEASKLIRSWGGLVNPEPSLRPPPLETATDDTGQDFEITKAKIKEIEERALAKLRGRGRRSPPLRAFDED